VYFVEPHYIIDIHLYNTHFKVLIITITHLNHIFLNVFYKVNILLGFTLVVSPMVSLMEDQIIQMQKLNVNAKMISSYSSKEDVKLLFQVLFFNFLLIF